MPRFVILRHTGGSKDAHFDLMLEAGGVLKTWALPQPPSNGVKMDCDELPDHRLSYLDYEGPVSGERGSVTRWECGTYAGGRLSESQWSIELSGERLSGRVELCRSADAPKRGAVRNFVARASSPWKNTAKMAVLRCLTQNSVQSPKRWRFSFR